MIRYIRAANVKDGHLELSEVKEMDFTLKEQSEYGLRSGDVLVTEGAGSLQAVGANAVWNADLDGTVCYQNHVLRLRAKGDTEPRFLGWWARHAHASSLFASIASGAQIYNLGAEPVRRLPVLAPPAGVQGLIADFLDRETAWMDRLLSARRRQLQLLARRSDVVIDALLSSNGQYRAVVPIKRLLAGIEQGWSPQCESRPADDGEWGVLKAGAANAGRFRPEENKALSSGMSPQPALEVCEGDVLVARANTRSLVGSVCVVPSVRPRLLLCDKLFRLRPREGVDRRYLAYSLRTTRARAEIEARATGTSDSMLNVGQDTIRELVVTALSPKEQVQIADALDSALNRVDDLRVTMERQIELLVERRQALITAAVTGQVQIPGVAA